VQILLSQVPKRLSLQTDRTAPRSIPLYRPLEVETGDRSGLLFALASALFGQRVQILESEVHTENERVYDRFRLVEFDGSPIDASRRLEIQVAVLTVSDTRTEQTDHSGALARRAILEAGHAVFDHRIVRDEQEAVRSVVTSWLAAEACEAVIVTGGTGVSSRDRTFEAISRLLEMDLPGFGRSFPPPDDDYSLRSHVRAVIEYLEYVKRGPVHLFGNSMGGAIAIVVAASRPDLVRTLTLVSPAVPDLRPRWRRQDPVLPLMMLPGLGTALLRRLEQASPEIRVRRMLQLCFADPTSVPPERLTEAVAEIRYRARLGWASDAVIRSLRGLVASYLAPGASRMSARMGAIRAPTLVVWGDRDRLVNVTGAARTARAIPGARLLVIRDVGHVAQMEQPGTVARAVLALLDDTPEVLSTRP